MAQSNNREDELQRLHEQGAAIAYDHGADPGALAAQLASTQAAQMGQSVAERYAGIGARWLADSVPTHLDPNLIDRLARMGFRRESLAEVRIHRGPRAQAAADALTARAFAVGGQDVFFGRGEYDPSSRTGLAVLAHELAHVAPPDSSPGGFAPAMGGGIASSFNGPVLNERKRGDEDAAGEEAHERQAREAERRVFAMDDGQSAPTLQAPAQTTASVKTEQDAKHDLQIDPAALEAKVMQIIGKWDRQEKERAGHFGG